MPRSTRQFAALSSPYESRRVKDTGYLAWRCDCLLTKERGPSSERSWIVEFLAVQIRLKCKMSVLGSAAVITSSSRL